MAVTEPTLGSKVEQYTGTVSDQQALYSYLQDGFRRAVDLLPLEKAKIYAVPTSNQSVGFFLGAGRTLYMSRGGYPVRIIPITMLARANDQNSLHYATVRDSVAVLQNGALQVLPVSGPEVMCEMVKYPILTVGDATVGLPKECERLAVLYAAMHFLQQQLSTIWNTFSVTVVELPPVPTIPAITYTPAGVSSDEGGTVGSYAALTVPTFADYVSTTADTLSQLETQLRVNEDLELAQGHVQELQVRIEEAKVQAESAFQVARAQLEANTASFTAELQKAIKQAELDSQKAADTARLATDTAISNAAKAMEATATDARTKLESYQAALQAFNMDVQQRIQDANLVLQSRHTQIADTLTRLQAVQAEYAMTLKLDFGMGAREEVQGK